MLRALLISMVGLCTALTYAGAYTNPVAVTGTSLAYCTGGTSALTGGQSYFQYSADAQRVYELITSLRLTEAQQGLRQLTQREPDNLIVHHLASYADFFRVYLSEEATHYQRLKAARDRRLAALADGDRQSPYYYYTQAEVRLHAALAQLRFEDYLGAFRDINQAHKLLLENARRFPDFAPTYKDLGIIHAAVGTVPDQYRWAVRLLSSLQGSVPQGLREVERAMRDEFHPFQTETRVLYCFLLLHLANQPDRAWQTIQRANLRADRNPLHCFALANVAMRSGHNDAAIRYLEQRPRGEAYYDFIYLDFMLGTARLRKLDHRARAPLTTFVNRYRGIHFRKEAQQKLAWLALLSDDTTTYHSWMQAILQAGNTTAGGDKNALKEARRARSPQPQLLRARLLFDGGYYERARSLLQALAPDELSPTEQLEYYYRMGRVLHGLKRPEEALAFYQRTVHDGRAADAFFACNAALQMGLIEEERGHPTAARRHYQTCLSLQPDEYRAGLHVQAKAGLSRLGQ